MKECGWGMGAEVGIGEMYGKPVLVFGCGNTLFGDDGFGPAVIEHLLEHYRLPKDVVSMDVGTGIRNILFDLLLFPSKPVCIFVVDAVCLPSRTAGEIFELEIDQIPALKVHDFSLHQFPSVNLLRELQESAGVKVRILAVQAGSIPEEVGPGMSSEVTAAVPTACTWLLEQIGGMQ